MYHLQCRDTDVPNLYHIMRIDVMQLNFGYSGIRMVHQAIRQALPQMTGTIWIRIHMRFRPVVRIWPQVIYASHMVIMLMSNKYRVKRLVPIYT